MGITDSKHPFWGGMNGGFANPKPSFPDLAVRGGRIPNTRKGYVYVCVCVCACVRACVRACVHMCVCVWMRCRPPPLFSNNPFSSRYSCTCKMALTDFNQLLPLYFLPFADSRRVPRTSQTSLNLRLLLYRAPVGHFLRGRSLKGRYNIRVYVPLCVCVCVCVFLCVCVPPLPPWPRPHCGAEQQNPTWPLTPAPASIPASNCATYPWEERLKSDFFTGRIAQGISGIHVNSDNIPWNNPQRSITVRTNGLNTCFMGFPKERRQNSHELSNFPIQCAYGSSLQLKCRESPDLKRQTSSCENLQRPAEVYLQSPLMIFRSTNPKDPAVLKTLRDSELLRRSVFATPPRFTMLWTLLWEENVCNSQENGVCTRCATIANRRAMLHLLRRVNLLRRSIFSTARSLGNVATARKTGFRKKGGFQKGSFGLRGPAAILFISRDTCSDSIAKLFRACFMGYRTEAKWQGGGIAPF